MKSERIVNSYDNISPNEDAKKRMLDNILKNSNFDNNDEGVIILEQKKNRLAKWIYIAAGIIVIIGVSGGLLLRENINHNVGTNTNNMEEKTVDICMDKNVYSDISSDIILKITNNLDYNITYDNTFSLEKKNKETNVWAKIESAYSKKLVEKELKSGQSSDIIINLMDGYEKLEAGNYRIVKSITINDMVDTLTLYSEFSIKLSNNQSSIEPSNSPEHNNVTLTCNVGMISNDTKKVEFTLKNNSNSTIMYDKYFSVMEYNQEDDEWRLTSQIRDIPVEDIAMQLEAGKENVFSEDLLLNLRTGKYRLEKKYYAEDGENEVSAEFIVTK